MKALPALLAVLLAVACASAPADPLLQSAPVLDVASPLRAVVDPEADPAVLLLDVGGAASCAGALLASDLVLTARRCVSIIEGSAECPAAGAQVASSLDVSTVRVLSGDDVVAGVERSRGRALIVPGGDVLCGADVAFLLLESPIDDVAPLVVQPTGAAAGDHARTVGFAGGHKVVRDHVPVVGVSSRELALGEAPCDGVPGGPAISETSGQVVGVLSRGAPACDAAGGYDVFTRADAFAPMLGAALAQATQSHASHQAKEKKGPVDVGASCTRGADCAAGACVAYAAAQYCTRACDANDRCPARYRCMNSQEGAFSCVAQ